MTVRRPDTDDVAALARSYGMQPSNEHLATYTVLLDAALGSYDAVEELYGDIAPQVPAGRSGQRPTTRTTRWAPGTSAPTSGAPRTGRWPGAPWRSRTTRRWPASR